MFGETKTRSIKDYTRKFRMPDGMLCLSVPTTTNAGKYAHLGNLVTGLNFCSGIEFTITKQPESLCRVPTLRITANSKDYFGPYVDLIASAVSKHNFETKDMVLTHFQIKAELKNSAAVPEGVYTVPTLLIFRHCTDQDNQTTPITWLPGSMLSSPSSTTRVAKVNHSQEQVCNNTEVQDSLAEIGVTKNLTADIMSKEQSDKQVETGDSDVQMED